MLVKKIYDNKNEWFCGIDRSKESAFLLLLEVEMLDRMNKKGNVSLWLALDI